MLAQIGGAIGTFIIFPYKYAATLQWILFCFELAPVGWISLGHGYIGHENFGPCAATYATHFYGYRPGYFEPESVCLYVLADNAYVFI